MPEGGQETARSFYGDLLGLRQIAPPEPLSSQGVLWFDAGGIAVHVAVEDQGANPPSRRHFGLECAEVDQLRLRLESAGVQTQVGSPAPWKRFFVKDPFGNRIEIHEVGGLLKRESQ